MTYSTLKQTVRKYYKYVYEDWTQPDLTENGTIGGTTFAVLPSDQISSSGNFACYNAFQTTDSSGIHDEWWANSPVQSVIMYNPTPIQITKLHIIGTKNDANGLWKTGTVLASTDNVTYTELATWTNSTYATGAIFDIDLNSNTNAYQYYKITINTVWQGSATRVHRIWITAQEKTVIEGTSSDYDFYEDVEVYKAYKVNDTYKALRS